jgi:signal transduction histidine kinase
MQRLLLSLYIVLIAVIAGSVFAIGWLWNHGLRTELISSAEHTALSGQYLLESELGNAPVAQWPDRIEQLKSKFGYEVTLLTLPEVKASERNLDRLRQALPALDESDGDIKYMLLPLRGSPYIARVFIAQQAPENASRSTQGFFYLLERQLAGASPLERIERLRALEQRFGYPVRSVPLSEIPSEADRARVRAGEIVALDYDRPNERFFKLLPGEERALQLGPFPRYLLERFILYVVLIGVACIVALALYFWVRPLWRDMVGLERGAAAIGHGQLQTRVRVSPRSPIHGVADTFNNMAQRVQELLKAQKESTDAISHELRTPISRLRFGVEMIEQTTVAEDRTRYLQTMRSALDELEALVDEALTYSRLTNAARRLSPETVDLKDWLADIIGAAQPSPGGVTISSEVTPPDASAHFDSKLVARALKNIIHNAQRYARSTVKVVIRQDGVHTNFTVEDDGPGIPVDQRAAIFEPFYRVDDSRQRDSGGHGLGLAIVRRICEWTHAEVSVEDSPLGGALFRLRWVTSEIT